MGRLGAAYSLLTREELPYLLDLHLYLGRPMAAAPEVPLLMEDGSVRAAADDKTSVYGKFPQVCGGGAGRALGGGGRWVSGAGWCVGSRMGWGGMG
jgi:hypothetical protein